MAQLKAVHYINQFFAGIGGETMADIGMSVLTEKKGPAIGLDRLWDGQMEVEKIIVCGDNFINDDENFKSVLPEIRKVIEEVKPDVFVAGPAFNAGRYGVACAKVCDYVQKELGVPSVTGMWHENPAVAMYGKDNYIIATRETAAGMTKSLPILAAFALKLARKQPIGPAHAEGYIPTGHRYNEYNEKTAAERATDMLLDKLAGRPYVTEIPLRAFEVVPPAPRVEDLKSVRIALITTGGLVPMGNPDKIRQAFATDFGRYDMTGLKSLDKGVYESIHGGYDTTFASADPHRLVPLDQMRVLEQEGKIGGIYKTFFATCGVGTNVESSKAMGRRIAEELISEEIQAAILTSTWGTCTRCCATIAKELDRAGIANAQITGFTSIAMNVGANRIIFGGNFTSPAGDPDLPIDREKAYRYKILTKALEALSQDVAGPTIFTVDEGKEGDK